MNMSLSKFQEILKDTEVWYAAVHGVTESDMTEQQQKILHLWYSFILQLEFVPLDNLHPILPPTSGKHNSFFLGCIISLFFIKNK